MKIISTLLALFHWSEVVVNQLRINQWVIRKRVNEYVQE